MHSWGIWLQIYHSKNRATFRIVGQTFSQKFSNKNIYIGGLVQLTWTFLKFPLGCVVFSGSSFGFWGQEETVNEKYSFLWLSNRSDRHRSCPVCRRQVTGASDSWVVSDAPTEDDIATYILNMVDEVGQPHRPWHWPQADNSTWSTWSFHFHKYLFLPLVAVLPQSVFCFTSWLLCIYAVLLKHRVYEPVYVWAVLIINLYFQ